jgi:hypothetical protein
MQNGNKQEEKEEMRQSRPNRREEREKMRKDKQGGALRSMDGERIDLERNEEQEKMQ